MQFGLHYFREELTGPVYRKFEQKLTGLDIEIFLDSTVMSIENGRTNRLQLFKNQGVVKLTARAVILAMGCRERKGQYRNSGTRPSGVFTAGLAQRLVNMTDIYRERKL